jgi:hypothetical protein
MKIIEHGKVEEAWTIRHRCTAWGNGGKGCEALLEIEYEDLRFFQGTGGEITWGYRDPAVSFKCPCCGKLTDLGTNDWPMGYKELKPWTAEWQGERPSTKSEAA